MTEKNEKTLGFSALVKMAATRTRVLENLLKFKPKSREKRKRLYKNLITALVQYERIETTINRCHDLSRVAERVSYNDPRKIPVLKFISSFYTFFLVFLF